MNRQSVAKNYDELEFRDDFMFGKVMEDMNLCREVLECLLQHPVAKLKDIQAQREFKFTSDGKPIRVDVYSEDTENRIYDAEMQNLNHKSAEYHQLPKRSRYYQGAIDIDFMNKGNTYKVLPESRVLFICTFDPFKKGLSQYTFRERCDEKGDLLLNDGTMKIFYNSRYQGDDIPDELRDFYEYVNHGKARSRLTEKIDKAVLNGRKNELWRTQYMKERVLLMDAKEEGREEGRTDLLVSMVCKKLRKGKDIAQIVDELEEDEVRIAVICEAATKFAPEYDEKKVSEELGVMGAI